MKASSTRLAPASAKSSAPLLQISIPCLFGKRQTEDDTQGYGRSSLRKVSESWRTLNERYLSSFQRRIAA
jgi:hypothetical protein